MWMRNSVAAVLLAAVAAAAAAGAYGSPRIEYKVTRIAPIFSSGTAI